MSTVGRYDGTTVADSRIMPELKLILECCKGQAKVKDAIQMKKAEISDELYNSEYDQTGTLNADFLSVKQKEDILYNNAARFLRLKKVP